MELVQFVFSLDRSVGGVGSGGGVCYERLFSCGFTGPINGPIILNYF